MSNYDEHYKGKSYEPVEVMEDMLLNGIPEEYKETILQNFRSAMAFKYQSRLNLKDDPKKELKKAENWLHRARTGEWITEGANILSKEVDKHEEFRQHLEKMPKDEEKCPRCDVIAELINLEDHPYRWRCGNCGGTWS